MADLSRFNQEIDEVVSTVSALIRQVEMAIDFGDRDGEWYPRKFAKRLRGQLIGVYKSVTRERARHGE